MQGLPRRRRYWRKNDVFSSCCTTVAQWLMVLLWGCSLLASQVFAAERGSIGGLVRLNGQELPEHRIMLIRFDPSGDVQRTPGQTDTAGHFTFDNLETGDAFEYVVGIRHEGQLYRSASVRLQAGEQRTGLVLEVHAETAAPPVAEAPQTTAPLHIFNHLIVLFQRDAHLEVREFLQVQNTSAAPYAGTIQSGGGFSLHIPLPHGYTNLRNLQGLAAENVRTHPTGIYYTAPLLPGDLRVQYTYSLPFPHKVLTLLAERVLPTAALDVLVEESALVATSDLQFGGRVTIEPHTFWHFRGTSLPPQARSWLQVTRNSGPATPLRFAAYMVVVGIALVGLGVPLYHLWYGRRKPLQAVPETQRQTLNAARVQLLQTIARLDDQHAAGGGNVAAYQQQRQVYKAELLALTAQLQEAHDPKEPHPQ